MVILRTHVGTVVPSSPPSYVFLLLPWYQWGELAENKPCNANCWLCWSCWPSEHSHHIDKSRSGMCGGEQRCKKYFSGAFSIQIGPGQQNHTFMEWLCTLIKVTVNLAITAIIMKSPPDLSLTCPIIGPSLQGTSKTISMTNITDTRFVTRFLRWNPLLIISVWRSPWPSISPFNRMFLLL